MEYKTIELNGETWDDIKDNPIIIKCNIENIYGSIKNIEFFKLTIVGEMEANNMDTNNIHMNGNINIYGTFKYYDMGDYENIENKGYITHKINVCINFKNNMLNGECSVMTKELDGYQEGNIYLRYILYNNNNILIDIDFFDDNLLVMFYDADGIDKEYVYFYKDSYSENLFDSYPEVKYECSFGEKMSFITNLLDGSYSDDFKKGRTTVYFTENKLKILQAKKIDNLYKIYKGKNLVLNTKDDNISFCFRYDDDLDRYMISMLDFPYDDQFIIELVVYSENDVELYAFNFRKYARSYISFDKSMNNMHILAKALGYKELHLYDHASKYINGERLPISLVRKLAGRNFFYEKFGYHAIDDIKEIEDRFEIFCERNLDDRMNMSIRRYFKYIDSNRDDDISKTFTGILDHIFNIPDNKDLFEMFYAIENTPFYKTL